MGLTKTKLNPTVRPCGFQKKWLKQINQKHLPHSKNEKAYNSEQKR